MTSPLDPSFFATLSIHRQWYPNLPFQAGADPRLVPPDQDQILLTGSVTQDAWDRYRQGLLGGLLIGSFRPGTDDHLSLYRALEEELGLHLTQLTFYTQAFGPPYWQVEGIGSDQTEVWLRQTGLLLGHQTRASLPTMIAGSAIPMEQTVRNLGPRRGKRREPPRTLTSVTRIDGRPEYAFLCKAIGRWRVYRSYEVPWGRVHWQSPWQSPDVLPLRPWLASLSESEDRAFALLFSLLDARQRWQFTEFGIFTVETALPKWPTGTRQGMIAVTTPFTSPYVTYSLVTERGRGYCVGFGAVYGEDQRQPWQDRVIGQLLLLRSRPELIFKNSGSIALAASQNPFESIPHLMHYPPDLSCEEIVPQ